MDSRLNRDRVNEVNGSHPGREALPAAWQLFIDYCQHLGHGQIERLVIQDGVPVLAEVTKQKIKFTK